MTVEVDVLKATLALLVFWNVVLTVVIIILNESRKLDIDILKTKLRAYSMFGRGRDY